MARGVIAVFAPGQVISNWRVGALSETRVSRACAWACTCTKCGHECLRTVNDLRKETGYCPACSPSYVRDLPEDLTGQVISGWRIIKLCEHKVRGGFAWECLCVSCGRAALKNKWALLNRVRGCNRCFSKTNVRKAHAACVTHGRSKTREYRIWRGMLSRCNNPRNAAYELYGARGIKVCDNWTVSFERFLADMGECPAGLSIDRKDCNGSYNPDNCRWATSVEQASNKRTTVRVSYLGVEYTATTLANKLGIHENTLLHALRRGVSVEEAISRGITTANLKINKLKRETGI